MKNFIIGLIVVVVIVGGYFLLKGKGKGNTEVSPTPVASESMTATPSVSASASPSTSVSTASVTVTYNDDAGYSPSLITVRAGTTIVFKNAGNGDMWPASAVHPTHMSYPVHGSCFSGLFGNTCHVVAGGTYSMKFDVVGTWMYHDHLNSQHTGSIIVTN